MNDISRISRNFIYLLAGGIFASLAEFLAEVLLARKLADTGYGHWAYAQTVFIYLILCVDLGLTTWGAREIAHHKDRLPFYMSNIIVLRSMLAVLISGMMLFLIMTTSMSAELKWLYAGGALIVSSLVFDPVFVFQGLERMAGIALWRVLNYGLFLLAVVVYIYFAHSMAALSWLRGLSYLGAAILIWRWIRKTWGMPSRTQIAPLEWQPILFSSLVIALSALVININSGFDTLVLGWYHSPAKVGLYAAAYRITGQFMGLALMFQVVFGPVLSRLRDDRASLQYNMQGMQLLLMITGGLVAAVIFLTARPLIGVLFGDVFRASVQILQGQMIILFLFFLQTGFLTLLLFSGRERQYFVCMLSGAVINLVGNLLVIPKWGYMGAVLVTGLGYFIVLLLSAYRVHRVYKLQVLIERQSLIFILFTILLVYLLSFWNAHILAAILFAFIYLLVVYFLFGKFLRQFFGDIQFGK